jgi:Asp-tRNA(Asn)/Glu-tRNA(Gln) amidotransferase A subunit family amidase
VEEGSSGSSAGSAAGVAAGLCAFAIGSETMGSILSPAERCSVVGLRPTFGRVSRHGAMALSWSLDKLGPLTRSVEDAALVLTTIAGVDPADPATREAPFPWDPDADPTALRVAAPPAALDDPDPALAACLADLEALGVSVERRDLPDLPTGPIMTLLMVEASAAFDELVRGDGMDALVRQTPDAWPTLLRAARFVPAADYVQAQRLQRRARDEVAELFRSFDLILTPGTDAAAMRLGNAAGAPALSLPCGRGEAGRPLGNVALLGRPFFEHQPLALAHALQRRRGPLAAPPAFAADAAG